MYIDAEDRKIETDKSYNQAISTILSTLSDQLRSNSKDQALGVIFGTHNRESVDTIISTLRSTGLAERGDNGKLKLREDVQGRVNIAQLYGMSRDHPCDSSTLLDLCGIDARWGEADDRYERRSVRRHLGNV